MKHQRLKLSAVLLLGLGLTGLQAQTLYVKESSGTQTAYTLSNIQKMSFSSGNLTVAKTDNSSGVYALSGLKHMNFTSTTTDIIAPTAPTNLVATSQTTSSISLSWDASTDNIGVTYYLIYKEGDKIDSVATSSYTVTGLLENTSYSFTVKARDDANNISDPSNALSAITSTTTDINDLKIATSNILNTYPNPVKDILKVDLNGLGDGTISILTLEGKLLQAQKTDGSNTVTLNLSQLVKGIYLCRYVSTTEIKTVKIIKQ